MKKTFLITLIALLSIFSLNAQRYVSTTASNYTGTGYVAGRGTAASPFVGDLDTIFSNAPANSTTILSAGQFYIKGNYTYFLKAGQKIIGQGKDVTVIKRDSRYFGRAEMFITYASEVDIESLTLDINATGAEPYVLGGIQMYGDHNTIAHVKAINASGSWTNSAECFVLFQQCFTTPSLNPIGHNRIFDCEVSSTHGDYIAGIAVDSEGEAEFNDVELPLIVGTEPAWLTAYQVGGSYNARVIHNLANGGTASFYTDTSWETNLTIAYNTFRNSRMGIYLSKGGVVGFDGVNINNNIIELNPNSLGGWGGSGIVVWGNGGTYNVTVNENIIRYSSFPTNMTASNLGRYGIIVISDYFSNIKVLNNTMASDMSLSLSTLSGPSTNGIIQNNTDINGNIIGW